MTPFLMNRSSSRKPLDAPYSPQPRGPAGPSLVGAFLRVGLGEGPMAPGRPEAGRGGVRGLESTRPTRTANRTTPAPDFPDGAPQAGVAVDDAEPRRLQAAQ